MTPVTSCTIKAISHMSLTMKLNSKTYIFYKRNTVSHLDVSTESRTERVNMYNKTLEINKLIKEIAYPHFI